MRDGTATRGKLRQAALELFVARGVDAVAIRDVTTAVGVTVGTLYVHWPSKDALVQELFNDGFRQYGLRLAAALSAGGDLPARLDRFVRTICALHDEDETLFAFLLLTQHRNLSAVPRDEAHPIDLIQGEIARAVENDEVPPGDPALLTAAIVGAIVHAATFRLYGRTRRSMGDMAAELSILCWRALGIAAA